MKPLQSFSCESNTLSFFPFPSAPPGSRSAPPARWSSSPASWCASVAAASGPACPWQAATLNAGHMGSSRCWPQVGEARRLVRCVEFGPLWFLFPQSRLFPTGNTMSSPRVCYCCGHPGIANSSYQMTPFQSSFRRVYQYTRLIHFRLYISRPSNILFCCPPLHLIDVDIFVLFRDTNPAH